MNKRNYTTPQALWSGWHRPVRRFVWQITVICMLMMLSSVMMLAQAKLPTVVSKQLSRYKIPESSVSAIVSPLGSNKAILNHLPNQVRNPASVMKLLTTYAALDILGPAYTWETQYFLNGELEGGVLDGDLVIRGGGDPYLVKEQFWLQLAALRELGIHNITGNLLIDNSAFDLPVFDPAQFDSQPTRLYNVGPSATLLNFNASRFRLRPNGSKVDILLDPPVHNVVINNQLKLAKGRCRGAQSGWSVDVANKEEKAYVVFRGKYRKGCGSYDLSRAVLESEPYLYGLFVYLWQNLGGEFSGGVGHAEVKEGAEPVYVGLSRTLAEVITGANKYSNNLLARQLLLSIGHHYFGNGASVKDGIDSVRAWLKDKELAMPGLVMENGAGLSRHIQLSANELSKLLTYAAKSPYQPEFMASFSLGGVDGTMRKRLKDSKPGVRARLKTGYVKGTRTLAGYLRADSGQDYVVVLFIQDPKVNFSNGNEVQDAFIRWVLSTG